MIKNLLEAVKGKKTKKVAFYIGRDNVTLINSEGLTLDQISEVNEDFLIRNNFLVKEAKEKDYYLVEYEAFIDIITKRWNFKLVDSKCWGDLRLDSKNYA